MTQNNHQCPRRNDAYSNVSAYLTQDTWEGRYGTCSYCGSMHPDSFMKALENGTLTLGPTDKNYKVYVNGDATDKATKFYFSHLSQEQQKRFLELLKEGKLIIGEPGHFYQLPFFITTD